MGFWILLCAVATLSGITSAQVEGITPADRGNHEFEEYVDLVWTTEGDR